MSTFRRFRFGKFASPSMDVDPSRLRASSWPGKLLNSGLPPDLAEFIGRNETESVPWSSDFKKRLRDKLWITLLTHLRLGQNRARFKG